MSAAPRVVAIPSRLRWWVAATIVEAVGLCALGAVLWPRSVVVGPPAPAYRTLSLPDGVPRRATIRVVLSPQTTLGQFRELLADAHLQVVAGPGDAGIWSLAPAAIAGNAATEAALGRLRANAAVRLAEPVETISASPP